MKRRGRRFPIVAGVIVVLGAAVSAWWLWPKGETRQDAASTKKDLIKEVAPAPAPKQEAPKPKRYGQMTREEKLQWYKDRYGDNLPENLKTVVYFLENPPQRRFGASNGKTDFLRHVSEKQIASLLMVEPGTSFAVKPRTSPNFDNDFMQAFVDKIDIFEDDSDEVRATKQAVIDCKKEIAEICRKEGRKPSEIVGEYAESLYELGKYKQNIEKEVRAIRDNPDYSDADVEDFYAAANSMLKAKGLPELKNKSLVKRSVRLRLVQKQAAARAARAEKSSDQTKKGEK